MKIKCFFLIIGFTFGVCAFVQSAPELQGLVTHYSTDKGYLRRILSVDFIQRDVDRMEAFFEEWEKKLGETSFESLNRNGRVDYIMLKNQIRAERTELSHTREKIKQDDPVLPFTQEILRLDREKDQGVTMVGKAAAQTLTNILTSIQTAKKSLEQKPKEKKEKEKEKEEEAKEEEAEEEAEEEKISKTQALRCAGKVKRLNQALERWYQHHAKFQPGFEWWAKSSWESSKKALEEYEKFLREKKAGVKNDDEDALLGEVVGEERTNELIREQFIGYDARELIAIGEREFAWCEKEMKKAAQELGFDDWKKALEHVKDQFVPPGKQAELIAQYAQEALTFLRKNKLITVPKVCEEAWFIQMVDEKAQKMFPYALYGGQSVRVAFATGSMQHEKKLMSMRGNNLHATRIVTAHEVFPGHHLQAYMSNRYRSYRKVFRTPFFVEGWALYWETILWDKDFARGPEDRIGMLFWRMHRCARIIVSLKYHLGEMEPKAMVDFLVDRVGHENAQATSEVRRYIKPTTWPLYQAAYMIGGIQLRGLRKELVDSGKMTEMKFHNSLLKLGPIPVDMMRNNLTETKLTPDYVSEWKF